MKKHVIVAVLFCLIGFPKFGPVPALADEEVQKTRSCQINTSVEWDIEEGETIIEGSLNYTVSGSLKLNGEMKKPVSKMYGNLKYDVEHLNMSYSYHERVTEKDPSVCKENPIVQEWSGVGSYQFGGGDPSGAGLYVRNMGTMSPPMEMVKGPGAEQFLAMLQAQAPQFVTNYYEFMGYGPPPTGVKKNIVISGRISKGDCTFRDSTKKLFPVISLRFKIPKDGKLKGEREWSAKYEGGMSMFGIGLSDLPETMEKEPYKPAKSGNGNISYNVNWSFEEVKPGIRIYRVAEGSEEKSKDITGIEEDAMIGEKIRLVAKALGLVDSKVENPRWKIDGKFIEDYKAEQAGTKLDKEVDLENGEVSFAWTRGDFSGKSTPVEVTGTVGGKEVTGKTTFKVFAPKIANRRVRCSPHVTLGERYNDTNLMKRENLTGKDWCQKLDADPEKYFDNLHRRCSVYPGQVGSMCDPGKVERAITAEHTVEVPWLPEQGYALQYVQLIKEDSSSKDKGIPIPEKNPQNEWCLDTQYPYISRKFTPPDISGEETVDQSKVEDEGTPSCSDLRCKINMEDTPELPLEGGATTLTEASLKHSFQTYLMFRPSKRESDKESLWVPMAKVTWGWSADAKRLIHWTLNLPCKESYSITNTLSPLQSGCSHQTTSDYPEWKCVIEPK